MKGFIGSDFMLGSGIAEKLYYRYAEKMPIMDFHNHLSTEEIYSDRSFQSVTQLWLKGDHYKWRAMRAAGVEERYITGDAGDFDKFDKWAKTVERLPGSPLYHWAHLELKRYFGINTPLSSRTAADIYAQCNEQLTDPAFTPVGLLKRAGVKALCTTDDPFDSLEWHKKILTKNLPFKVLPTFRPDKILHIRNSVWVDSVSKLGTASGHGINSFESLKTAAAVAVERFAAAGCLASDQGFERFMYTREGTQDDSLAGNIFDKAMSGLPVTEAEAEIFESRLLLFFGELYSDLGFCMQLHTGASRNVNSKLYRTLGPDAGGDNIGYPTDTVKLGMLLDDLNVKGKLPRTVLYGLNPADLPAMTSLAASFCGGDCPGMVQVGSAWWFNDTEQGIRAQLRESAYAGLLSSFVGMVTDSRSFSSFVRHEYFRRILCDMLGDMVEKGEYPEDMDTLGSIVQDICYNNAVRFLFKVKTDFRI